MFTGLLLPLLVHCQVSFFLCTLTVIVYYNRIVWDCSSGRISCCMCVKKHKRRPKINLRKRKVWFLCIPVKLFLIHCSQNKEIKQRVRGAQEREVDNVQEKHFMETLVLPAVPTFPWLPSFQLLWKSHYAGREQYGIKISNDKEKWKKYHRLFEREITVYHSIWESLLSGGGLSHHVTVFNVKNSSLSPRAFKVKN